MKNVMCDVCAFRAGALRCGWRANAGGELHCYTDLCLNLECISDHLRRHKEMREGEGNPAQS